MATVNVPADATNYSVYELLRAVYTAQSLPNPPPTFIVRGQILADPNNTDSLAIEEGGATLSATSRGTMLAPGDAYPLNQSGVRTNLTAIKVRNDTGAIQSLDIIAVEG